MELAGQNIIVFDLEIKNEIGKNGIGWTDYDKMGISVGCAFDFKAMDYLIYMDDDIEKLAERMNNADLISGFNIEGFDIPLLEANLKMPKGLLAPLIAPRYDIMIESKIARGYAPNARVKGNLDDHLSATFGPGSLKTEHGSEAPIFWREGKLGRLVSYVIGDVKREGRLLRHAWEGKPISTPMDGPKILRDPRTLMKRQEAMAVGQ